MAKVVLTSDALGDQSFDEDHAFNILMIPGTKWYLKKKQKLPARFKQFVSDAAGSKPDKGDPQDSDE